MAPETRKEARVSVLLGDGDASTRARLRAVLEQSSRVRVCAEAGDAIAALDAAAALRPDMCLLDSQMPGGGIAAAWEIAARVPETRIVMLTPFEDEDEFFLALRAGAVGYLPKDTNPSRLAHTLLDVLEGEAAVPRTLVASVLAEYRDRSPRRRKLASGELPLTSREWEVLDLLRQGETTAEIASRLSITKATARSHIASLRHKLGASDRAEAVRLLSRGANGV